MRPRPLQQLDEGPAERRKVRAREDRLERVRNGSFGHDGDGYSGCNGDLRGLLVGTPKNFPACDPMATQFGNSRGPEGAVLLPPGHRNGRLAVKLEIGRCDPVQLRASQNERRGLFARQGDDGEVQQARLNHVSKALARLAPDIQIHRRVFLGRIFQKPGEKRDDAGFFDTKANLTVNGSRLQPSDHPVVHVH